VGSRSVPSQADGWSASVSSCHICGPVSRANAAIEQFLAKALGLRRHQVHIVAGSTERHTLVDLDIADLEALRARLIGGRFRAD
jgi:uncharacterized protein YggU (UPF0235/DUF167 family)